MHQLSMGLGQLKDCDCVGFLNPVNCHRADVYIVLWVSLEAGSRRYVRNSTFLPLVCEACFYLFTCHTFLDVSLTSLIIYLVH